MRRTDDGDHLADAFRNIAAGMSKPQALAALKRACGNTIHPANFDRMLRNEAYAGRVTLDGVTFHNIESRLVTDEVFEQVQRVLIGLAAERRREPTDWPFSGVARCSGCGGNLRVQRTTAKGHRYAYVCCRANCVRVPASFFGETFATYLAAVAVNGANLLENDSTYAVPSATGQSVEEARAAVEEAKQQAKIEGQLISDRIKDYDNPDYRAALDARDAAQATFDSLSGEARNNRAELAELVAVVDALSLNAKPWPMEGFEPFDVVRGWEAASFEQQRQLVTMALDRIVVSADGATSWTFRKGLVQPLDLPALAAPGSFTARADADDDWRHLDTDKLAASCSRTRPALAPDV
jgi:hypothetical protein